MSHSRNGIKEGISRSDRHMVNSLTVEYIPTTHVGLEGKMSTQSQSFSLDAGQASTTHGRTSRSEVG